MAYETFQYQLFIQQNSYDFTHQPVVDANLLHNMVVALLYFGNGTTFISV